MSETSSRPKVAIPEVRIDWWMYRTRIDRYEAVCAAPVNVKKSMVPVPEVMIRTIRLPDMSNLVDDVLVLVRFEVLKDGVHVRFSTDVTMKNPPELHLVMKRPDMRKVTSAILSVIAIRAEAPELGTGWNLRGEWLRKMYERLESIAEARGSIAFQGVKQQVVDGVLLCKKSFDKASGMDVDGLKVTVRKAFEVLTSHLDEEDIVRMWRETVASQVVGS